MKVFITGIAGFIGFHTALKFRAYNHEVVGIDNFNDYYDPDLKRSREIILKNQGVDVIMMDLRRVDALNDIVAEYKPDLVIHLAAMAGVRYSMDHAQEYIDVNVTGTNNLIQACEYADVQNVIYASTSCVMEGHPLPWKEYEQLGPHLSPYGYTKGTNESQFHISKIPNAVGLRFFTVYGPYGRPDMALFDFTKRILAGEKLPVFNNGNMKRDFTYVDDVVQGIFLVSQNMSQRDIYCIGNGTGVNLMDFIREIEFQLGIQAEYEFLPKHPADVKETLSDTTKIQKLGYQAKTPIALGVKNFVKWYKEYYSPE